jgi:hypothetical protein
MEQVSVKEFSSKIKDKKDLYEAVHRNGYFLPSRKSSMVSEAYLLNVMEGSTFCLKMEEVRLRACPRPPNKFVLVEKFLQVMKDKGLKSHGLDQDHLPDKEWLISVLSSMAPDDEIFKKDYVPPPRKNLIEEHKTVRVPKDFMKGLPESRSKSKRRALKLVGAGIAD